MASDDDKCRHERHELREGQRLCLNAQSNDPHSFSPLYTFSFRLLGVGSLSVRAAKVVAASAKARAAPSGALHSKGFEGQYFRSACRTVACTVREQPHLWVTALFTGVGTQSVRQGAYNPEGFEHRPA